MLRQVPAQGGSGVDHNGETPVLVDIESWKLTLENGVAPQKQQGRLGTARVVIGKCEMGLDLRAT